MRILIAFIAAATIAAGQNNSTGLLQVKRICVGQLTGSAAADAMRDLLISSIAATGLFTLTDNADRADAVLKGAADDQSFTDTFDSSSGVNTHQNVGRGASGSSATRAAGAYLGASAGDNESHHIKERKHEAYATVRLCNRDGDVLWSTTQESLGAKFRGASSDVAAKVARQLTLDFERARAGAGASGLAPGQSFRPSP
jgi:hypothetical protein